MAGLLLLAAWASPQAAPAPASATWSNYRGDRSLRGVAAGELSSELTLTWKYEAEGAITSSPVLSDGKVFFGSDDMKLHAVDATTGALAWSYLTDDLIEAPPLVLDGKVVVGSSDFFVYCLEAATGNWSGRSSWVTRCSVRPTGSRARVGPRNC